MLRSYFFKKNISILFWRVIQAVLWRSRAGVPPSNRLARVWDAVLLTRPNEGIGMGAWGNCRAAPGNAQGIKLGLVARKAHVLTPKLFLLAPGQIIRLFLLGSRDHAWQSSGLTPGFMLRDQRNIWGTRERTQVIHMQGKSPIHCTIPPNPNSGS